MTLLARNIGMFANQLECKLRVIHADNIPAIRSVTRATVRAKLAVVMIVFRMAGITIHRRALENIIDMALRAGNVDMFASQLEGCKVMIKCGGRPAVGCVARAAVLAEMSAVRIIFQVAG